MVRGPGKSKQSPGCICEQPVERVDSRSFGLVLAQEDDTIEFDGHKGLALVQCSTPIAEHRSRISL